MAYLRCLNLKFLFVEVKLCRKSCRIWLPFNIAVIWNVGFCMSLYLIAVNHELLKPSVILTLCNINLNCYERLQIHINSYSRFPFLEAGRGATRQDISRLLWQPNFHYLSSYFCFKPDEINPLTSKLFKIRIISIFVGRDSVLGIATDYGLDGSGIEFRWGWDFLHPSRLVLGLTQTPVKWVPGVIPGGKAAEAWR
jgi:hypothetical protein